MARIIRKLTAQAVTRATKRGYLPDGGGLYLQVSATGAKSWVFRYRQAGRLRELGLGSLHTVGLAEARVAALAARKQRLDGADPIAARKSGRAASAASTARTFAMVAEQWLAAHECGYRNDKHRAQVRTTLTTYAFPTLGTMPVASITTGDVLAALRPIWQRAPETASRLRGRIEAVLSYAKAMHWREAGENPAAWKDNLDHLLPATGKIARVEHHAALPWQNMGSFMAELRQRDGIGATALQFTILTAARSGETRGAAWSEIDLPAAVWTIPAARMKAGREHRVPLSDAALAVLRHMEPLRDDKAGGLVFPGTKAKPLSDMSLSAVVRRMGRGGITVHGFRSTFRDWCAEATNYPREIAEAALAHVNRDKVEAAYARGDHLARRARLMAEWAEHCARPAAGG